LVSGTLGPFFSAASDDRKYPAKENENLLTPFAISRRQVARAKNGPRPETMRKALNAKG
jgi:hypothetical protein